MVATYLDEILAHHRARAHADVRPWRDRLGVRYEGPSMLEALANQMNDCVKVIAEVKRRSPSKGWLNENLDVAALDDQELASFLMLAHQAGIDALVEVHDLEEATRAVDCGARIIGVNQRNLRTFDVDRDHAASVIDMVPSSIVTVCESGLRTSDDVARAAEAGFDAVLVGETFVTSESVVDTVRAFSSVALVHRG